MKRPQKIGDAVDFMVNQINDCRSSAEVRKVHSENRKEFERGRINPSCEIAIIFSDEVLSLSHGMYADRHSDKAIFTFSLETLRTFTNDFHFDYYINVDVVLYNLLISQAIHEYGLTRPQASKYAKYRTCELRKNLSEIIHEVDLIENRTLKNDMFSHARFDLAWFQYERFKIPSIRGMCSGRVIRKKDGERPDHSGESINFFQDRQKFEFIKDKSFKVNQVTTSMLAIPEPHERIEEWIKNLQLEGTSPSTIHQHIKYNSQGRQWYGALVNSRNQISLHERSKEYGNNVVALTPIYDYEFILYLS
ncbi:MAG: hypothetical protein N0E54_02990 [Candidatus Thiodiazotropha taylori]|nr:hypothetical protein [Candidatus Thiodiazotropha endolucinida]MCW4227692.1 hypothetical protein [Candidatus Thiodiazotropha taylori]